MEYALVKNTERVILITVALNEFGEEKARSIEYECPECGCQVFPSFPLPHKNRREKAPSAYFSARGSEGHRKGCFRDSLIIEDIEVKKSNSDISSSNTPYPQRFLENESRVRKMRGIIRSKKVTSDDLNDTSTNPNKKHKTSVGSSCRLQRFVDGFEIYNHSIDKMPIQIQGCHARTFKEAFVPVENLVTQEEYSLKQIFYGLLDTFVPSKNKKGISLLLKSKSLDQRNVRIWIPKGLMPFYLRKQLWDRINLSSSNYPAKIYIVGRFRLLEDKNTYSLFLPSLNHIWVTLPGDNKINYHSSGELPLP